MSNPTSGSEPMDARALNRRVWQLTVPIMFANLSVPLLGAVDTAVMGHLPDAFYLGAVAVGATIVHFIFWGFGFLRMGTAGLAAQAFGARNGLEIRAVLARAGLLGVGLGAALLLLQWPIAQIGLTLFEASDQVEGLAETYFFIRIWSAPAVLVNYVIVGWFIGVQNTRAVMILQVFMNGLNIILDLWFVLGLGWDVAGVAAATVIAEFTALAVGVLMVRRELRRIPGSWQGMNLRDADKIRQLVAVNRDIFIRTACLMFAFAFFTARGAKLGDNTLAANAVLIQFQQFLSFGLDGFAHAAEALVGGAVGARDRRTLRLAVKICGLWAAVIAAAYTLVYAAVGPVIIGWLTDLEAVRTLSGEFLIWVIISPIISVWSFTLDGVFIGATRTAEMRNGMIISLAIYLAAVFALQPVLGNHGLWLAFTIFMAARAVTLAVVYPNVERAAAPAA
ncbi:MAG: MATE family efflux transporter [Rhodospirillales bacterium]|nr:MATE family efflux transporter [Rhodospirillales bacterium]